MPTLFIDCDDTLYLRRRSPDRRAPEAWEPNWPVVSAMQRWMRAELGPIVIWSAAGEADAEIWRRRIVPHMEGLITAAKDMRRPGVSDILIDDMRLAAAGTCYQPEQSFMVAPDAGWATG